MIFFLCSPFLFYYEMGGMQSSVKKRHLPPEFSYDLDSIQLFINNYQIGCCNGEFVPSCWYSMVGLCKRKRYGFRRCRTRFNAGFPSAAGLIIRKWCTIINRCVRVIKIVRVMNVGWRDEELIRNP